VSDANVYQSTYMTKFFSGLIYGILIYKNAIIAQPDHLAVQLWLGDRYGLTCPLPAFPNVAYDTVSSSAPCGFGFGTAGYAWTTACLAGTTRIGGVTAGETYACASGKMASKGMWCGEPASLCPVVPAPTDGLSVCSLTQVSERFDQPQGTLLRSLVGFDVQPPQLAAVSDKIWLFGDGVLTGSLPYIIDGCSSLPIQDQIFTQNRPTLSDLTTAASAAFASGTVTYSLDVVLGDFGASAGIAFRVSATSHTLVQYYRAYVSAGTPGVKLEYVSVNGITVTVTPLAQWTGGSPAFTPTPGTVYAFSAVTSFVTILVAINGAVIFSTTDARVTHGTIGTYLASGVATFDNMVVGRRSVPGGRHMHRDRGRNLCLLVRWRLYNQYHVHSHRL